MDETQLRLDGNAAARRGPGGVAGAGAAAARRVATQYTAKYVASTKTLPAALCDLPVVVPRPLC